MSVEDGKGLHENHPEAVEALREHQRQARAAYGDPKGSVAAGKDAFKKSTRYTAEERKRFQEENAGKPLARP